MSGLVTKSYDDCMKEKFFVRGNLALDWYHVAAVGGSVKYIAVDNDGGVWGYTEKPTPDKARGQYYGAQKSRYIGSVGEYCKDWDQLIFKLPEPPHLPLWFWAAVDIFEGLEYMWLAFDGAEYNNGAYLYSSRPTISSNGYWRQEHNDAMPHIILKPCEYYGDWKNSLTARGCFVIGQTSAAEIGDDK
jgi:hypothetical protein